MFWECHFRAKFNGVLSFHGFPTQLDLRRQWLVNIRRENFTITSHSKVCSRHFAPDQLINPTTLDGRRRLVKGAVPMLFEWNSFTLKCCFAINRKHFQSIISHHGVNGCLYLSGGEGAGACAGGGALPVGSGWAHLYAQRQLWNLTFA